MISFKYSNIEERIPFFAGSIYDVTIESPSLYLKFISDLLAFNEDNVFIYDDEKGLLNLKDEFLVLTDPFSIDPNTKKYLSSIYKMADKKYLNDERSEILLRINSDMNSLLDSVSFDFDTCMDFDDELSLGDLMNLRKFRISIQSTTYSDLLITYLKSIKEISSPKYIFVIGFLDIIKEEEMDAFLRELSFLDLMMINISSRRSFRKLKMIKSIIIDQDLCEY